MARLVDFNLEIGCRSRAPGSRLLLTEQLTLAAPRQGCRKQIKGVFRGVAWP